MKTRFLLLLMVIAGMLTACSVTLAAPTATPTPDSGTYRDAYATCHGNSHHDAF